MMIRKKVELPLLWHQVLKVKDNNLKSATDQASGQSQQHDLIDHNNKENLYINLPSKIDLNKLVVGHKKVYSDFKTTYWNQKLDSTEQEFKNY